MRRVEEGGWRQVLTLVTSHRVHQGTVWQLERGWYRGERSIKWTHPYPYPWQRTPSPGYLMLISLPPQLILEPPSLRSIWWPSPTTQQLNALRLIDFIEREAIVPPPPQKYIGVTIALDLLSRWAILLSLPQIYCSWDHPRPFPVPCVEPGRIVSNRFGQSVSQTHPPSSL